MTPLVTIVECLGIKHAFVTPSDETIGQLTTGAIDHFQLPDSVPAHIWRLCLRDHRARPLPIDPDITIDDLALRERLQREDLQLVAIAGD